MPSLPLTRNGYLIKLHTNHCPGVAALFYQKDAPKEADGPLLAAYPRIPRVCNKPTFALKHDGTIPLTI